MGEYGGGVWRCEEVSPHTSALHYGHRRTVVVPTAAAVLIHAKYKNNVIPTCSHFPCPLRLTHRKI